MIVVPCCLAVMLLVAEPPKAPAVPEAARATANFDVESATNAWLATIPPEQKARSDAYFEGGYWLILVDFLWLVGVMVLLLETRFSARMRDWAARWVGQRFLQSWLYWIFFTVVVSVLMFPLTVYEGFFREHSYGLSNLSFGGWLREEMLGLGLSVVLGGLGFSVLAMLVRRLPNTWHVWGAGAGILFTALAVVVTPVFIAPLFNTYKPLGNQAMKQSILSMALASGIPVRDVYEVDASKQSKRVSANVSGFLGTERITLNDNLLARCSPAAIQATMGHEMGHYVMHHLYNGVMFSAIVTVVGFGLLRRGLESAVRRRGERWGFRGGVSDDAALPAVVVILSTLSLLFMPVGNSFTRQQEYEADLYGLNASRQPDGEAEVDLLLGEYRKMEPGKLEEMVFFDHPSGRTRIRAAMRWKAENLCLFDAGLKCSGGRE